jgi:gluconokinase
METGNKDPSGNPAARSLRLVVMGICGCGKSEVGRRLASRAGYSYAEGDEYHPASNVAKMAAGLALDDSDRADWLATLRDKIREAAQRDENLVLSCSALKRRYRDLLRQGDDRLVFIHLHGSRELITSRMQARKDHFMPVSLIDSQLRDLQPLEPDEAHVVLDISRDPDQLVTDVLKELHIR